MRQPFLETLELEVDHGRDVECQELRKHEPAHYGETERPAGIDDRLRVTLYFPGVSTSITAAKALEIPHTFFGVTARDPRKDFSHLGGDRVRLPRGGEAKRGLRHRAHRR